VTASSRWRALLAGLAVTVAAFLVYWLSNRTYDAGRGDLFYLADALFLKGELPLATLSEAELDRMRSFLGLPG